MTEFEEFPKIARWNRNVVITEKIDGTNGAVVIEPARYASDAVDAPGLVTVELIDAGGGVENRYHVYAQSRNRFVTPGSDNHGFARWVQDNAAGLVRVLGPGRHFGEWWGEGIQRGYGIKGKRFSLFNTARHTGLSETADQLGVPLPEGLGVVPVLFQTTADKISSVSRLAFTDLAFSGSKAAPGFMRPEGVVIYHTAARQLFKWTFEMDGGKWLAEAKGSN